MISDATSLTDPNDPRRLLIKSRLAGTLLATIVLAAFALANLPYQYVETEVDWIGFLEVPNGGSYRVDQSMPVMAGWPLRYWIRYDDGLSVEDRLWLPWRLGYNLAFGLLIAAGVYLFLQIRRRKMIERPDSVFLRRLFDCSVALAIVAVPGVIFGWQYWTSRQHHRLARQVSQIGSSCLSCWLPSPINNHVPAGLKRSFVRLREIHVFGASQEVAEAVCSIPSLSSIHFYSGDFDSRPLNRLSSNRHLCALQLSRRDLGDADLDSIVALPWLRQLRLSRSNLDSEQLRRFDRMPLRLVDLSFTNIELDQLGKPGWSSTVERLSFSRPADGIPASLTLEGWPRLRVLRVERRSEIMNDAVLSLRLVDLPRLERLSIDRVQKHDLCLKNVPRLARVDEEVADLRFVISTNTKIPGRTWVRSLEIDGADSLSEFDCFARDLEQFSIARAKGLRRFSLGSYLTTLVGEIFPQDVDPDQCQGWIDHLGKMHGPTQLDLSFLPLELNDLSSLSGNAGVRHLHLSQTGVSYDQVQKLEGMQQLETLNIGNTPLAEDALAWLLDRFPNVEVLMSNVKRLTLCDLRGRNHLKELHLTPLEQLRELRIVDLPRLRTNIRLTHAPDVLEIRNAPSLRGFAMEGPWPENATFEGLRDLEWFTGGGEGIDDEVVEQVLRCVSLDRLTLAYPAVSQDMLRRIGNLRELTFLALPGTPLNDDIVRDWSALTGLWEVNLDDTQVSVETIGWLSRIESLRRVSIKRVALNEAAADALGELTQISELYLAGVPVSPQKLRRLLRHGGLETLDLSGWKVDPELVDLICSDGFALKHLVLRDTQVDLDALQRLMEAAPSMYVELDRVPGGLPDSLVAELHRRAAALRYEMNTGWRQTLRPGDDVYQSASAELSSQSARSDGPVVELPATYMSQISRQQLFSRKRPSKN
jgi:hypothetical protein